jgi:glyoxylase-like metal-dependent hydrolase (beta-lactamase superfamily II)
MNMLSDANATRIDRRLFLKGALASFGVGVLNGNIWAEMAKHPLAGKILPKWEKGHFRINMLYNGRGESAFLVFPDSTSMLIDCGEFTYKHSPIPYLPKGKLRAGELISRFILRENPNGKKVDYFMLSHYHSDHAGSIPYSAGKSANGKYSKSGIGIAIDYIDFGKFIDRAWPNMSDPAPRTDKYDSYTVKHVREVYSEVERRGIKVEKFRLEKDSDQISLLHGGCPDFKVIPLCSNGQVLRRDGTILDLGTIPGQKRKRNQFDENPLSIGLMFALGDFRYFTAGDFSNAVHGDDGAPGDIEPALAAECPEADVTKANHYGHRAMPVSLIKALRSQLVVGGIWHLEHMDLPTMRRYAKATSWPCLFTPCYFPKQRQKRDAKEKWLKDVSPECFSPVHVVIDVAPDGKTYRVMMVDASDEAGRIVGAYDFKTTKKKS